LQKLIGLLSAGNIAGEEYYSGWLHSTQEGTERRGNFNTVESDNEKLANLLAQRG
jgi:hypothetical protein